jgi:GNAT superfamily N-acetyltransferase
MKKSIYPHFGNCVSNPDPHIRPVDLRTDLPALADLIELVFAPTMDESGRAAIREMRYMSRMGVGLTVLGRLNEMMSGIKMGYVWVEDGRLIGNVSIYPAHLPGGERDTWIIANVGVHPDYQRRGIARRLMQVSLEMLRRRGARAAILQVDYRNDAAIHLYERLGFVRERAFGQWQRSSVAPVPRLLDNGVFITRRRPSEWAAELSLAQQVRPNRQGGVGWLKPTVPALFRKTWRDGLVNLMKMASTERLIVRSEDERAILASLWLETQFGVFSTRLTLMYLPGMVHAANALLTNAVRRLRSATLTLEHPFDDAEAADLFRQLHFSLERTVWHMRLDLPRVSSNP